MVSTSCLGRGSKIYLADIVNPNCNSFGVIRLAMALTVLASHSFYFVTGQVSAEPLYSWTGHTLGEHAVQVFFFLSGFLVTESLLRHPGLVHFATGRILRIFPGLIVCVLLTALVLGPLVSVRGWGAYVSDASLPLYVLRTVLLATGSAPLPGVFDNMPAAGLVNMSLWTVKFEVLCYGGLALFGVVGLRHEGAERLSTALLATFVLLVFLRSPTSAESYSVIDNLRYFGLYFATGMLASRLKEWIVIDYRTTVGLLGLFIIVRSTPFAELSCALLIGSFTLLAATWTFGPLRHWCNARDLSFGVYIYAAPIQQGLLQSDLGFGPVGLTIAALVPALVIAYASWVFIEKPALGARSLVCLTIKLAMRRVWETTTGGPSIIVERSFAGRISDVS